VRFPLLQTLRNWAAGWLMNVQMVQERLTRAVADLEINYRKSPIVGEQRGPKMISAKPQASAEDKMQSPVGGKGVAVVESEEPSPQPSPKGRGSKAKPGDRAPDAATSAGEAASRLRIYDALKGAQFVLLGFSGDAINAEALSRLRDSLLAVKAECGDNLQTRLIVAADRLPDGVAHGDDVILDPHRVWHAHYAAEQPCLYLIRPDRYIAFRCQPPEAGAVVAHLQNSIYAAN